MARASAPLKRGLAGGLAAALLASACVAPPPAPTPAPPRPITLEQAIAAPYRVAGNRARDRYRHPQQTLDFFGVEDDMTVVEIWPGAGWWTEILAPYLRARGKYIAAQVPDQPTTPEGQRKTLARFNQALKANPQLFDRTQVTALGPPMYWEAATPGTADRVLTFRNIHNWMKTNTEREMFAAFFRALKPGGVLGVEEHRGWEGMEREDSIRTGYVDPDYVIQLAQDAGFVWVAWEEINANPKDTKNYFAGVWTLPPTLRLGDFERQKYLDIGESDRMTLKFVKPDPRQPRPRPVQP